MEYSLCKTFEETVHTPCRSSFPCHHMYVGPEDNHRTSHLICVTVSSGCRAAERDAATPHHILRVAEFVERYLHALCTISWLVA